MNINIKNLRKYLLEVDIESFIKSMQDAINECPQGIYDSSARNALRNKEIIEDCFERRLYLFTLKDSKTLNAGGYFQFLSNSAKEIHHYAEIYERLIKIKQLDVCFR